MGRNDTHIRKNISIGKREEKRKKRTTGYTEKFEIISGFLDIKTLNTYIQKKKTLRPGVSKGKTVS